MSDSFLDRFLPDPDFDDTRWFFSTEKLVCASSIVEFAAYDSEFHVQKMGRRKPASLDPSCLSGRVVTDQVSVFIFERRPELSEMKERAWNYLLSNASLIEEKLTQKLSRIHIRCLSQFLEEELPGNPSFRKHWAKILAANPDAESSPDRFFKLVGICLLSSGLEECAFTTYEFQSAWDLDHGLEIVMHQDKVLAAAGLTELAGPDTHHYNAIKATQSYEMDPGDTQLP